MCLCKTYGCKYRFFYLNIVGVTLLLRLKISTKYDFLYR